MLSGYSSPIISPKHIRVCFTDAKGAEGVSYFTIIGQCIQSPAKESEALAWMRDRGPFSKSKLYPKKKQYRSIASQEGREAGETIPSNENEFHFKLPPPSPVERHSCETLKTKPRFDDLAAWLEGFTKEVGTNKGNQQQLPIQWMSKTTRMPAEL